MRKQKVDVGEGGGGERKSVVPSNLFFNEAALLLILFLVAKAIYLMCVSDWLM